MERCSSAATSAAPPGVPHGTVNALLILRPVASRAPNVPSLTLTNSKQESSFYQIMMTI